MRFGVHTGLQSTTAADLRALWRRSEELGFEWISIWDHFYAADPTVTADTTTGSACLEAVAAHAALALETTRVRCGSLVYCVGYRHPAVLANAAVTLDHLSGGRVTMGLGGGWHRAEFEAYGMRFEPVPVRLRRTDEAIRVIRMLLTQEATTFSGELYELRDARCDPKPVQPSLPLWIGGGGEQVTLRTAARHADGSNVPFIAPVPYRRKVQVLHEHCERAGRDPSTIEKSVNVALAWTEEELRERFGGMADWIRPSALTGSTAEVVDRAGGYADAGADWLILALRAPFDVDGLERFATEVVPALRTA